MSGSGRRRYATIGRGRSTSVWILHIASSMRRIPAAGKTAAMTIQNGFRIAGRLGAVATLLVGLAACDEEPPTPTPAAQSVAAAAEPPARVGDVVAAEPLVSMDLPHLTDYLRRQGFDPRAVRYGVDAYRIRFHTTGASGEPAVGSGIVALPRNDPGTAELPVTTYLHGTNPTRAAAASLSDGPDRAGTLLFAGVGQAAVAPDYPGLGLSDGLPAYMLPEPAVHAALDGVRAARTVAEGRYQRLGRTVNVSGFSQGAQAAVPLGRALQEGADPQSDLGAVAAVAGPHDMFGTELPASLDGRVDPHEAVLYLGYVATAWNRAHHLYGSPSEAFRAPYDRTADALFDGTHTFPEIIQGLPDSPQKLFRPEFLQTLLHPTGELADAVTSHDRQCAGWSPNGPVRLFHGTGDRDVPFANSQRCLQQLRQSGGRAELVNAGPLDHNGTAIASFPEIADWFASLSR